LINHDNVPTRVSLKTTGFVTNNSMVVVPHPLYSSDLAVCDFALFAKLRMRRKVRLFQTVSNIQEKPQAVLDSKETDFHAALEAWENDGIAVYVTKETVLKETAAKIERVKSAFLF
jgi:hypothetical protein